MAWEKALISHLFASPKGKKTTQPDKHSFIWFVFSGFGLFLKLQNYYPMNNDPELNGKYLGTISNDFVKVCDNLKEASYQIRDRGFSKYPIFPMSKSHAPVGQLLIKTGEMDNSWNYNASFLNEFVQRSLIESDKEDEFIDKFKDPDEFCCLFVLDKDFTNFVFIPYPIDW